MSARKNAQIFNNSLLTSLDRQWWTLSASSKCNEKNTSHTLKSYLICFVLLFLVLLVGQVVNDSAIVIFWLGFDPRSYSAHVENLLLGVKSVFLSCLCFDINNALVKDVQCRMFNFCWECSFLTHGYPLEGWPLYI